MAIITISREMGSGGIPIAHGAAEKLGYTLIDGEAIREAAPKYGLSPEALENADEKPPPFVERLDGQVEVDFHQIELIILEYALRGNVIIYGRGGQDLLAGIQSVFRVRIITPFEERVERWAEREWLDPELARILVRKSDQQRAGFIKYYFDRDWEDPLNYDLVVNTSRLSEEMAIKLICEGVKDQNLVERKDMSKAILGDLILKKKVEIALLSAPREEGHHIVVDVQRGVATLSGHVPGERDRKNFLAAAESVSGVSRVEDHLKIVEYRNLPREH